MMTSSAAIAIPRGRMMMVPSKGVAGAGGEEFLDSGCIFFFYWSIVWGFPSGSDSKESACNAGDPGSTPGLGRFLGE